jgi:hypothetical protein
MINKHFWLQPFSLNNSLLNWEIKAHIASNFDNLIIHYQIFGDFDKIKIPHREKNPTRQDDLWKDTCFECFLGVVNSLSYWEFNLSPSGNWNVYSFSNYREGMKREKAFSSLPFEFAKEADHLSVKMNISLKKIINNLQDLEIAITLVIKDDQDTISYWALKHQGEQADFHRRDSFVKI